MDDQKKAAIQAAALKLDVENDAHWTVQGDAKLDTLKFLVGDAVSREELEVACPGFNRASLRKHLEPKGADNANPPPLPTAGSGGVDVKPVVAEQAAVEADGPEDRTAEVEALAEEIRRTDEAIQQQQRISEQARDEVTRLTERRHKLDQALVKIKPPKNISLVVQDYHERMKQLTRHRAQVRKNVRESGVDVGALVDAMSPSPIDQALRNRPRPGMR